MQKLIYYISFYLIIYPVYILHGQEGIIDQVVAVVGNNIILQSDVENQYLQYRVQGYSLKEDIKCEILESFLVEKLLINQAIIDSIEVNDNQVESEFNQRYQMFIKQIGSEEKLEEYWKKPIMEIKEDLREAIYEQMVSQQMQAEITGNLKIAPSEVRSFYNKISKDSLPLVNAEIEICQITKSPSFNEQAIFEAKEKLLNLRKRIISGEDFTTLAILYSVDPSARKGGELGLLSRAELDTEFAKAAFSLKENGVSRIVESEFGYHIIQLIEKKDDLVNVRHILIKPRVLSFEVVQAKRYLDSIANLIRSDSISFEIAARLFSEDKNTKMNGGLIVNPQTGTSKFLMDQLNTPEFYAVNNLKIGEISDSFESTDDKGKQVFKIIVVKSWTKPHKVNLKDDYLKLQELVMVEKQQDLIKEWIREKQKSTYIHIDDSFKSCNFFSKGWVK